MMIFLRSTLFNICFILATVVMSTLMVCARPFGFSASWFFSKLWAQGILFCARILCGIHVKIEGKEHIPDLACVVMAKHQSAFETIVMPLLIPSYVWVLKRELFYIPIFGWALWAVDAIAIRRGSPREALKQVMTQGKHFLAHGRWVAMFPEGTRSAVGTAGEYKP
ncbi:MAG: lysophospholipid acyltransferase family protein, partial [Mariprofundaceae bacterium]